MEKKELWLALSALGLAVSTAAIAAPEKAGVASKVNPVVEGQIKSEESRVIFVGSDIFRDETIRTGETGQTHLMFLDQSSLSMGPDSELAIDEFVYEPKSNKGAITLSSAKGLLRFVGGAASKTGDVTVRTPLGNLGIRGAVVVIDIPGGGGDVTAYLLYGDELKGSSHSTGVTKSVKANEHYVILKTDGRIETGPIPPARLPEILDALSGPKSAPPPKGRAVKLPENYSGWLRQLSNQDSMEQIQTDENINTELMNRDIDSLAS
ncbi:MAG: FecR domain-containing protein [Gammaproteobacteria bacterium]|nr:FecR domain-containing protein [Gammaproteobacteria bacterium]